jgi:transglutaminase-like putative cysteine protease
MASRSLRVAGWVGRHVLKVMWVSLMVLTPLFGFWLASSLAAYENASQWLALLVGLLLFPIVPVGWDLVFAWRRRTRPPAKAILTRLDRLVLRTLLINGLFLGGMMWRAPETAFRAIAVRGDWILDGYDGPIASSVRGFLLGIADRFERRWHKADDAYGTSDKPPDPVDHDDAPTHVDVTKPKEPDAWPLSVEPDIQVTGMPESVQTSVDAVGKYLAARIADKRRLVKALHDYVVLRLHYDKPTSELVGEDRFTAPLGKRPSQEAEAVFAARTGVCEGYARLMVGLGKAAGVEVAYITGYIRDSERNVDVAASDDVVTAALEGNLHAWNAVKVDGQWLLVDATWDDPTGDKAADTLRSTYLFTPPRLFRFDHLPEETAWQLIAVPLSAGEFARQPLLSPRTGELGITLEEPTRSQITVDRDVEIVLDNPLHAELIVVAKPAGGNDIDCPVRPGAGSKVKVGCALAPGQYEVRMFGALRAPGVVELSLDYIGSILVNSR